ncbi:hypothetical protein CHU98_g9572 [Xylaria longipes]|nr:hypothetical protein CHU98_g9572 [Xylaria longipes]
MLAVTIEEMPKPERHYNRVAESITVLSRANGDMSPRVRKKVFKCCQSLRNHRDQELYHQHSQISNSSGLQTSQQWARQSAAASGANAALGVADFKKKSKKAKAAAGKIAKKQQEADLAGIGSQFQQEDETQQLSNPANYPQQVTLDE